MCPRSVPSCQNWPTVPACWGLLSPNPSSNTLAVPPGFLSSTNPIHMLLEALAKPLTKTTGKERTEGRAWEPSPETLFTQAGGGACGGASSLFPQVLVPTASMSHRHTAPGPFPKPGKDTKASPGDLFPGICVHKRRFNDLV